MPPTTPVPSVLSAALEYAQRGWRVIPLPVRHDGHDADGKAPAFAQWQKDATKDPAQIAEWWRRWPTANVGVLCDPSFGFVVDVDDPEILEHLPDMPRTLMARTPSGGYHLVFRHPTPPLGNDVSALRTFAKSRGWQPQADERGKLRGIDVRGKSGQIVVWPSTSPRSGGRWVWMDEAPIAEAPQWMLDVLRPRKPAVSPTPLPAPSFGGHDPYVDKAVEGQARDLAAMPEGSRGKQLFAAAARLGELGVPLADTERALMPACDANGLTGKDGEASVRRELRRGWDQGAANPVERPPRDVWASPEAGGQWQPPAPAPAPPPKRKGGPQWVRESKNGAVVPCLENTQAMLDHYNVKVRYNLMSHQDEILVPTLVGASDKRGNASLAHVRELARRHDLPAGAVLDDHLCLVAERNPYHPVAEWIRSAPWDGVDRFEALFASLELSTEDAVKRGLMYRLFSCWLITAAHSALVPATSLEGINAQLVLILQGPQGVNKTRWLTSLVPRGRGWVHEGVALDPNSRDSVQQATSVWIVELGEFDATLRKADIAALKAFITSRADTYRAAYARMAETHARRSVYAASVNERGVLHDDTGSRRFAIVSISGCNPDHGVDMQQLWAQAAALPEEARFLSVADERALLAANEEHQAPDPVADLVMQRWEADPSGTAWVTLRQVLDGVDSNRNWSTTDSKMAARALRNRMQARTRKRDGYEQYSVTRRVE